MAAAKVTPPDHVLVGFMTFAIEYMTEDEWASANENPDWCGVARHAQAIIRVRVPVNINIQHLKETVLHEILHCCWSTTMLTHSHDSFSADDREEEIISAQSPALLFVLQQNPHVVKWLVQDG